MRPLSSADMSSPLPLACRVRPEHLQYIDRFLDLLLALNDPFQDRGKLERLVGEIPILAARLTHRARGRSRSRRIDNFGQALVLVGNRGLEAELLELLEELTVLKADLEEAQP